MVSPSGFKYRLSVVAFFFVIILCPAVTCRGHDMVDAVLYRLFGKISVWTSKPPVIDESLRGKIREDVLLCIGATNRTEAANIEIRFAAAKRLKKENLSEQEVKLLYAYLAGKLGERDPLWEQDVQLIKSSICGALIWRNNNKPVDGFGTKLIDIIASKKQDVEWRKTCLRYLGDYYAAKWKDDPKRFDNLERKNIEVFLFEMTKDKHLGEKVKTALSESLWVKW